MTLTEERCPTCDGSGFVVRNEKRHPCPTCSPASDETAPYFAPNHSRNTSALPIVRLAAYLVGAAALFAALAVLIKLLWY